MTHKSKKLLIQDITTFMKDRRKYWKEHVNRMEDKRIVKRAKDDRLQDGKRVKERPAMG